MPAALPTRFRRYAAAFQFRASRIWRTRPARRACKDRVRAGRAAALQSGRVPSDACPRRARVLRAARTRRPASIRIAAARRCRAVSARPNRAVTHRPPPARQAAGHCLPSSGRNRRGFFPRSATGRNRAIRRAGRGRGCRCAAAVPLAGRYLSARWSPRAFRLPENGVGYAVWVEVFCLIKSSSIAPTSSCGPPMLNAVERWLWCGSSRKSACG